MPETQTNTRAQFAAVDELLTRWLSERRALLTCYTELVVTLDNNPPPSTLRQRQLVLCQRLVDYASAGHFEVFHELLEEAERFDDGGGELAAQLIPSIGDTTEVVLAYEEKYGDGSDYPDTLMRDLSALGEVLESRFELEDRLIAGLHSAHRRLVEPAPDQVG
jgi:regulator of sigma D